MHEEPPRIREGFAALRVRPVLGIGVGVLGVGVTISAGTWIGGMPTLVRDHLHGGAGAFSIVMVGYAAGAIASGGSVAVAGAFAAALGQSSARVLLVSAAQEDVPDALLGRVPGLVSLVHRGAHATGLLLVAPVFAVVAPHTVFAGAAVGLAAVGIAGAALALVAQSRLEGRA